MALLDRADIERHQTVPELQTLNGAKWSRDPPAGTDKSSQRTARKNPMENLITGLSSAEAQFIRAQVGPNATPDHSAGGAGAEQIPGASLCPA